MIVDSDDIRSVNIEDTVGLIDVDDIEFEDGDTTGVFNLHYIKESVVKARKYWSDSSFSSVDIILNSGDGKDFLCMVNRDVEEAVIVAPKTGYEESLKEWLNDREVSE